MQDDHRADTTFVSVNPATGEVIESFPEHSEETALGVLDEVHSAWKTWRSTDLAQRSATLMRVADLLERDQEDLAATITREMGKPISQARAEIAKCAFGCRYFADNAPSMLEAEPTPSDSPNSLVAYEPLGVILAVMPWNFPFWQVFRHAAPAMMAGNAVLLKHAPTVGGCARAIERIVVRAAGLPILRNVFVRPPIGYLIADPRVAAVTLTGSTRAGKQIGALAGEYLKPSVLELGGSDPFIVLEDADIAKAAEVAVTSRFQNTGQSCIAAKRFIVAEKVIDEFSAAIIQKISSLKVGDPSLETTEVGPLARADLRDNLDRQVQASLSAGAEVVVGGHPLPGPGFFYEPTLMTSVTADMPAMREETFGPVAVLVPASDEDEAVAIANDSDLGLGGNIWSEDIDRALRIAARIETGGVFINGMTHSDPRIPFGGVKMSGYGRELGRPGLLAFTNIKTVWRP